MNQMQSVRFELTKEEKKLLESIAELDGRAGMSSTIRRMIRKEAQERGLVSQNEVQPQVSR